MTDFFKKTKIEYLIIGLHLAVMQYAYIFLLEAYLSSRSVTYFICLFFWLIGFLSGLNINRPNLLPHLILLGGLSYEIAYVVQWQFPYRDFLYPIFALTITISAFQAGYFFAWASERRKDIQQILFKENNGFVIGTFLCMVAVLYLGFFFLAFVPSLLTLGAWLFFYRLIRSEETS